MCRVTGVWRRMECDESGVGSPTASSRRVFAAHRPSDRASICTAQSDGEGAERMAIGQTSLEVLHHVSGNGLFIIEANLEGGADLSGQQSRLKESTKGGTNSMSVPDVLQSGENRLADRFLVTRRIHQREVHIIRVDVRELKIIPYCCCRVDNSSSAG